MYVQVSVCLYVYMCMPGLQQLGVWSQRASSVLHTPCYGYEISYACYMCWFTDAKIYFA